MMSATSATVMAGVIGCTVRRRAAISVAAATSGCAGEAWGFITTPSYTAAVKSLLQGHERPVLAARPAPACRSRLATPVFATEFDLSHMELDAALVPNVQFGCYPSGHMIDLNTGALKQLKADLAKF